MMVLEQADLEEKISSARRYSAKRYVGDDTNPVDYSKACFVIDRCSESIAQVYFTITTNVQLALEGTAGAEKRLKKVLSSPIFDNAVIGRVAHLEGGGPSSSYSAYDTPEGNQVDIFLRSIGYLK